MLWRLHTSSALRVLLASPKWLCSDPLAATSLRGQRSTFEDNAGLIAEPIEPIVRTHETSPTMPSPPPC